MLVGTENEWTPGTKGKRIEEEAVYLHTLTLCSPAPDFPYLLCLPIFFSWHLEETSGSIRGPLLVLCLGIVSSGGSGLLHAKQCTASQSSLGPKIAESFFRSHSSLLRIKPWIWFLGQASTSRGRESHHSAFLSHLAYHKLFRNSTKVICVLSQNVLP